MPNLSFKKTDVQAALRQLVSTSQEQWKLANEYVDEYVETMEKRIRVLCRHVQQGIVKSPKAAWVTRLPWGKSLRVPLRLRRRATAGLQDEGWRQAPRGRSQDHGRRRR